MKVIASSRGKPQILWEGYSYRKHRFLSNGFTSWRCTKKNCRSRLRLCEQSGKIMSILPHNHVADYDDVTKREFKSLLRNKAKTCSEPSQIVLNAAVREMQLPSTKQFAEEKGETLRTLIRRTRQRSIPTSKENFEKKVTIGAVEICETKETHSCKSNMRYDPRSSFTTSIQNFHLQCLINICDVLPSFIHFNSLAGQFINTTSVSPTTPQKKFLNPVQSSLGKIGQPRYVFFNHAHATEHRARESD